MTKKIVLADDERFITIAYRDGLMHAGFEVIIAHDGAEALETVKKQKPDLLLLDLVMPKMNGFDVLKTLKADPDLSPIPVVVLSNLSQEIDEAEVRQMGAADFYVKSDLSLAELINKIHQLIGE